MRRKLTISMVLALFITAPVHAATPAADDAADPVYDNGWVTGDNGGFGWGGPWTALLPAPNFAVASSALNGDGDSNNDGDIDTNGRAWAVSASAMGVPFNANRPFDGTLSVGQTVTVEFDHGVLPGSGQIGIRLTSSLGEQRFALLWFGSNQHYYALGDGLAAMNVAPTDEGLVIEFTLTGSDTFSVRLTPIGGSPSTATGSLATGVDVAHLVLHGSSSGVAETFFFNSISVPEPGVDALSVAAIAALALLARSQRKGLARRACNAHGNTS